jgi:phage tail sheath protein FI
MANEYLYGAYGHIGDTVAQSAVQAGTIPVYVGTAPVNLIRGYADAGAINVPVKIVNLLDAQRKLGYSSDWGTFTLCEALTAHFDNPLGNIGPIYMINVLNPEIHKKEDETTKSLSFTGGRCEFKSSTIILDTLVLADKVEGTDFVVDYNFTKGAVIISSVDADAPLTGTIVATYDEVDIGEVEPEDIIGGITAGGEYSGLGSIALLYPEQYAVANLIAAPGWSDIPAVYNAMIAASAKINGHWDAFAVADIPLTAAGVAVDTIEKAKTWKASNAYTNERTKVYWPQAIDSLGRVFHLSTLAVVEFMRADFSHNSVPMETCGNKAIPVIRQFFGAGSSNRGFDQQTGKELTSNGISTAVAWGGQWVLWGNHTAAYIYGADVDPRGIFDVSMRMLMHITNSFQREWSPEIDEPMTRALKDRILNREQEKLDAHVSMGALIGTPAILFLESENPQGDIMNGDFRWDIQVTPTPPLKSASVYVAYTDAGFSAYFEGGE